VDDDERSAMSQAVPVRAGMARVGRVSPRGVLVVAAALLVLAAVVGFTQGRDYFSARGKEQGAADAVAAGRQLAVNFTTLDYRHVDDDTRQVLDGSTGTFKDQYAKNLAALKKVIVANQTVSIVKRSEAAYVSGDSDSARVIVGVVAQNSNTVAPQGTLKTYRMRLDLQRSGSTWKVNGLDFVG
jgi:Mce-associated membrane protein